MRSALCLVAFCLTCVSLGCNQAQHTIDATNAADLSSVDASVDQDLRPGSSPTPQIVEIFVPSGVDNGDQGGCYFASEVDSSSRTCEIYRLRWDLSSGKLVGYDKVLSDPADRQGVWQPSLTRDGKVIGFSNSTSTGVSLRYKSIGDANINDPTDLGTLVQVPARQPNIAVWPNWSASGKLSFDRPNSTTACMTLNGCVGPFDRWSDGLRVDLGGGTGQLGAATQFAGNLGFSFSDASHHPTAPDLIAGHGWFVDGELAIHPICSDAGGSTSCSNVKQTPGLFVMDLAQGNFWRIAVHSAEEKYKANGTPLSLYGCAHAAWSPDGKKLLCSEQGTAELDEADKNRIFAFTFDPAEHVGAPNSVVTKNALPAFKHKTAEELWNLSGGEKCTVFYHKYAEWCGTQDYLLTSVACNYCESGNCENLGGKAKRLIGNRVYLIDIRNPDAPVYHNLTGALETQLGSAEGSLFSFTGTCGPVQSGTN